MSTTFVRRDGSPAASGAAAAALLVFDITDTDSFDRVKSWVKELRKMGGACVAARISQSGHSVSPFASSRTAGKDIVLALAANKCDLERNRQVSQAEAEEYAASIGAAVFQTSAKANRGVEGAFAHLAKRARHTASLSRPGCVGFALLSACTATGVRITRCDLESPACAAEVVARGGVGGGGGGADVERCAGGGTSAGRGAVGGLIQLGAAADERRPAARHSDCCG